MKVILTGAGFSANWGSPLALEIASYIFNFDKIQNHGNQEIKSYLYKNKDYEEFYDKYIRSDDGKIDNDIKDVIDSVYKYVNKVIQYNITEPSPALWNNRQFLIAFLQRLVDFGEKCMFFTLNQDLLIENICKQSGSHLKLKIYGIKDDYPNDDSSGEKNYISEIFLQNTSRDYSCINDGINYCKLHGSSAWFESEEQKLMVIGRNKKSAIRDRDILKDSLQHFDEVLISNGSSDPSVDLLIIGYSFSDDHINEIILKALSINENLRLHIINPVPLGKFLNDKKDFYCHRDKIKGYYPVKFIRVLPIQNENESQRINSIYGVQLFDEYFNK